VALLRVGVSVVGAPPQYTQILYGVIILVAVALSIDRSKLPTIK
jgi:ribose transport system permease protein